MLGSTLRVFAENKEGLECLGLSNWLNRLMDYCSCSAIQPVPKETKYVRFQRKQFLSGNIERLAKRRAKRKQESLEAARAHYSGFIQQVTKLPFIHVQSLSNNKRFRLFIEMTEVNQAQKGVFTCYGLSKSATVPWF